jgi:hypothetical protein
MLSLSFVIDTMFMFDMTILISGRLCGATKMTFFCGQKPLVVMATGIPGEAL